MRRYFPFLLIVFFTACAPFRQDVMFKTDPERPPLPKNLQKDLFDAEATLRIAPGDFLQIQVNTNKGELLIDPNFTLRSQLNAGNNNNNNNQLNQTQYLVDDSGFVKAPIIGDVRVMEMTLKEAEYFLEEKYAEYYKDPFVNLVFLNKRVIVLGTPGGQVIRLENPQTNLLEVLAMAGGVTTNARSQMVRIIRGPLNDPQVFVIDLSTVEGMQMSVVPILPNDIVYVEPIRRKVLEQVSYLAPIVSLMTSILTLILIFTQT
jgi:polysaccharide export outer membrane protein